MIPNLNPKNDPYCCISAAPAKSQLLSERVPMSDMSTVRFTRPVMILTCVHADTTSMISGSHEAVNQSGC